MSRIKLGIWGAGLFARDSHAPALNQLAEQFEVVAVCSRTADSAQELAALFPNAPTIYTDASIFLQHPDLEAVDIVLPIHLLPTAVEQALVAGKHVISEKPIAPDLASGQTLLAQARQYPDLVWLVGENWRYEEALHEAKRLLDTGAIGTPVLFHWTVYTSMNVANKYYHTAWRRDNSFNGGFVLDAGVHHIAGLRFLFGEVQSVSAHIRQFREDLPPMDTISASLHFANGLIGTYAATYAVSADWEPWLHIVGDAGQMRLQRGKIELTRRDHSTEFISTASHDSVGKELADFARLIRHGGANPCAPEQALQDVAVLEAMMESATKHTHITPVHVV